MVYKSFLILWVSLSLGGCVAYGDGGYGHRGYERHASSTYYQVQRYPVYVVPQYWRYKEPRHYDGRRDGKHYKHRHDDHRYGDSRHSQHYYAPAQRYQHGNVHKPRYQVRAELPQSGWSPQPKHHRQDRDGRRQHQRAEQYQNAWPQGDRERRRW